MATPDPIDSGRYFWVVLLAACRKRTPALTATSSKPRWAGVEADRNLPPLSASAPSRNDLRCKDSDCIVDLRPSTTIKLMTCRLVALALVAYVAQGQTRTLAEQAFDAGRYDDAARLFDQDYRESSRCGALFGLGISQYRLNQRDAALIAFQSSVQCDPKLTLAFVAIGDAYSEKHNSKESLSAYLRALDLEPNNSSALHGAAAIYLQEKLPQKAVEVLELLVRVEPRDPQVHADLGAVYLATGNQEGAEKQFREALVLKPNDATALLGLANIYLKGGDTDNAIATLRRTLDLAPKAYEPHFLLGSAYNRQGRYQDAAEQLQAALKLGSQDSEVYYHLARAYGGLGKTEERTRALAKFTQITNQTKANTEALRQATKLTEEARSFVDAGDLNAAASRLEQAREIQPGNDGILFRLASVHYDLQKYASAREYAEEAVSLAPSVWLYHYLLGLIEIRTQRWQEAGANLRIASQLNPSATEVQAALKEVANH